MFGASKKQFNFIDNSILAMDEAAVWNYQMFNTTIDIFGVKDILMKTTCYDKAKVLVCPAAKLARQKCSRLLLHLLQLSVS